MSSVADILPAETAEQSELTESAVRFLSKNYSLNKRRHTQAIGTGYDRDTWAAFADLGWLALPFSESAGGLDGSAQDLAAIMTALGPAAVLEPYLDGVVLAGTLLSACPPGQLCAELTQLTIAGRGFATVALLDERGRSSDAPDSVRAQRVQHGIELRGRLSLVPFAAQSEVILVPARDIDDGSISIYAIRPSEAGLREYPLLDGGVAADVVLDCVTVADSRVLAGPNEAPFALAHAMRVATYCVCAEAVAIMAALIGITAQYLNERKQFGQPLAQFQALQHTLADMTIAHARSDSATWMAGHFSESGDANLRDRLLAAAKYEVGQAGRFVGQRAVQLHGAIGMTDELIVGHHFKRLVSIDLLYGGWLHQLQQFVFLAQASQQ